MLSQGLLEKVTSIILALSSSINHRSGPSAPPALPSQESCNNKVKLTSRKSCLGRSERSRLKPSLLYGPTTPSPLNSKYLPPSISPDSDWSNWLVYITSANSSLGWHLTSRIRVEKRKVALMPFNNIGAHSRLQR